MSTEEKLDLVLAELKSLRDIVEARPSPPSPARDDGMLASKIVMERLGYSPKSRGKFWAAVRRQRIPHTKINRSKILFPAAAVEAWLANRTRNAVPA